MEITLDWAFRLLVIGVAVWAVKGFITTRTAKVMASDQYLSVGELDTRCERYKESILKEVGIEMNHIAETIKGDLKRGQERFGKVDEKLDGLTKKQQDNHDTLIKISLSLEQLVKSAAPAG